MTFPRVIRLRGKLYCLIYDVEKMLDDNRDSYEIMKVIKSKLKELDKFIEASYVRVYER